MNPVDFSIVLPCLNEENTIGRCIDKIQAFFKTTPYSFEIVVADNGSTDRSQEIARTKQARIVLEPIKGYGNALKKGIENCYGKYIIMGDADDSYNFLELHDFIKRLEEGYDMVIGNRFAGGIHHQAMPWLHRYIGNPILSSIARILFKNNIKDYHCGLRAFRVNCIGNYPSSADKRSTGNIVSRWKESEIPFSNLARWIQTFTSIVTIIYSSSIINHA